MAFSIPQAASILRVPWLDAPAAFSREDGAHILGVYRFSLPVNYVLTGAVGHVVVSPHSATLKHNAILSGAVRTVVVSKVSASLRHNARLSGAVKTVAVSSHPATLKHGSVLVGAVRTVVVSKVSATLRHGSALIGAAKTVVVSSHPATLSYGSAIVLTGAVETVVVSSHPATLHYGTVRVLAGAAETIAVSSHPATLSHDVPVLFTIPQASSILRGLWLDELAPFSRGDSTQLLGLYRYEATLPVQTFSIPNAASILRVPWLDDPAEFSEEDAAHLLSIYRFDVPTIIPPTNIILLGGSNAIAVVPHDAILNKGRTLLGDTFTLIHVGAHPATFSINKSLLGEVASIVVAQHTAILSYSPIPPIEFVPSPFGIINPSLLNSRGPSVKRTKLGVYDWKRIR